MSALLPQRTNRYVGLGPLMLARLTHEYEGRDDIEFLAVQDAVEQLSGEEQERYRLAYIDMMRSPR